MENDWPVFRLFHNLTDGITLVNSDMRIFLLGLGS